MTELQTLKRARQDSCVPNVQGRLTMQFPDEGDEFDRNDGSLTAAISRTSRIPDGRAGIQSTNWNSQSTKLVVEHPPTYRKVIAGWTDPWRERWGLRANSLEELGLTWRDAETQAFVEIWNQIRENAGLDHPAV